MLEAQWRLTVVTFTTVPLTIVIMKVSLSLNVPSLCVSALKSHPHEAQ